MNILEPILAFGIGAVIGIAFAYIIRVLYLLIKYRRQFSYNHWHIVPKLGIKPGINVTVVMENGDRDTMTTFYIHLLFLTITIFK